jgi:hypothetical protein
MRTKPLAAHISGITPGPLLASALVTAPLPCPLPPIPAVAPVLLASHASLPACLALPVPHRLRAPTPLPLILLPPTTPAMMPAAASFIPGSLSALLLLLLLLRRRRRHPPAWRRPLAPPPPVLRRAKVSAAGRRRRRTGAGPLPREAARRAPRRLRLAVPTATNGSAVGRRRRRQPHGLRAHAVALAVARHAPAAVASAAVLVLWLGIPWRRARRGLVGGWHVARRWLRGRSAALSIPLLCRRGWRSLLGRLRWCGAGSPEVTTASAAAAAAAGAAGCGSAVCGAVYGAVRSTVKLRRLGGLLQLAVDDGQVARVAAVARAGRRSGCIAHRLGAGLAEAVARSSP